MCGNVEADILNRGCDADTADVRFVVSEDNKFSQGDDGRVV